MKNLVLLLCILSLGVPAAAQAREFKGWVFYEDGTPSPQSIIIKNQDDLELFLHRVPPVVPTKKHPSPKNPDPILKTNAIDFQKHTLVVALRDETISAHPKHLATDTQEDKVVVWFSIPDPPPEARPFGWGTYRGLLVPRTDKPIFVKFD